MTELIATLLTPKTTADFKAVIDLLLNEMLRIEAQMQLDRVEIEYLRIESQVITKHTDAVLERLGEQIEALGKAA